jgi:Ca2+-binding RTX toxin-like protein
MAIVNGTSGGDTLYGTGASDQLNGLGGNDSLKGFGGADRLDGGAGIDTVFYGDSTVGVGINLVTGRGFGGTAEGDTLISIEKVFGSNFNDTIIGTSDWHNNNQFFGGEGNDVLKGGGGDDYLDGGNGNDVLNAGDFGISILDGGSGDDTLKGGGGHDTLIGGVGNDTADYSGLDPDHHISVSLATGQASNGDRLSGIENLVGHANHDTLEGDGGVNVLRGMGGNDTLNGGGGADVMYGGTGGDMYYADPGDTLIEYAGEGFDQVFTSVSYRLAAGSDLEWLSAEFFYDTAAIDLTGNELDNYIGGNNGSNVLDGGAGIDSMNGHGGNDTYIVDNSSDSITDFQFDGFDRVRTSVTYSVQPLAEIEVLETTDPLGTAAIDLVGNFFNNTILGNNGQNTIVGGRGLDVMAGGGGGDVFVWRRTAETGIAGSEADVVADFNRAGGDLLAFNPIDANTTGGTANDEFTFVGIVDVTAGGSFTAPGQIGYFTTSTDTFILLNTEVDAGVDFQDATIRVAGVHTVDASWFVL